MKFLISSIITGMIALLLLSFGKDAGISSPLEGNWNGFYGNDNELPSIPYKLNVRRDGVIEEVVSGGLVKGAGNWNLNGTQFTAHYQWKAPLNTVFTLTATYNPITHKLMGTWGFDNSAVDGGKWEVTQSN
jgi:hypothetical protein